jgi:hypothetical protein
VEWIGDKWEHVQVSIIICGRKLAVARTVAEQIRDELTDVLAQNSINHMASRADTKPTSRNDDKQKGQEK